MFSFEVGFGAPLLLTTSALFLFYSRMALTDIAFTFFFTAATISLYKAFRSGRIRDTVYAGLISAGCMAIKYNGFMPLIVAASYAPIMVRGARDHEKPRQLIKYLTQLLVASLPTLAFIVLFLSLLGVGGGIGGIASMRTVKILASSFPDLISKGYAKFHVAIEAHRGQLRPIPLIEAPFYIRVLVKWVPLPTLLFTLIGLASCDFKKVDESFASYWLLLTFALISSIPARYSRAILPALPPLSLTSALGIAKLPTMLRPFLKRLVRPELWMNPHKKPMLALTILLLIAVSSLPSVKDTVAMSHNAYRDAGQILKSRTQGYTVIAETQRIIAFYHPVDFWRIKGDNLPEEGFIVVDHIAAVYGDHEVVRKLEVEGRIELVAAIVNDSPDIVYLDTVSFDELPKIKEDLNYTTIRIYKIK
jgi:4-amino-4-deoxy-L-arabinose transferase-like glycosyltransferase